MKTQKSELIERVALKVGIPVTLSKEVCNAFVNEIIDSLATKGDKVALKDFGVFTVKLTKGKMGFHFKTKEPLRIPDSLRIKFKCAKSLVEYAPK